MGIADKSLGINEKNFNWMNGKNCFITIAPLAIRAALEAAKNKIEASGKLWTLRVAVQTYNDLVDEYNASHQDKLERLFVAKVAQSRIKELIDQEVSFEITENLGDSFHAILPFGYVENESSLSITAMNGNVADHRRTVNVADLDFSGTGVIVMVAESAKNLITKEESDAAEDGYRSTDDKPITGDTNVNTDTASKDTHNDNNDINNNNNNGGEGKGNGGNDGGNTGKDHANKANNVNNNDGKDGDSDLAGEKISQDLPETGKVAIEDAIVDSFNRITANNLSPPEAIFANLANTLRIVVNQLKEELSDLTRANTASLRNAIDVFNELIAILDNLANNPIVSLKYFLMLARREEEDIVTPLLKTLIGAIKDRGLNNLHGRYFRAARLIAHRYGLPYSSMVELANTFILLNETNDFINALKEEDFVRAELEARAKETEIASLATFAHNGGFVVMNNAAAYDRLNNVLNILNNSVGRYTSGVGVAVNVVKIKFGETRAGLNSIIGALSASVSGIFSRLGSLFVITPALAGQVESDETASTLLSSLTRASDELSQFPANLPTAKTVVNTVETAKSTNSQSITAENKTIASDILNNVLNILNNSVAKYVSNIKVTINAIKVGVTGAARVGLSSIANTLSSSLTNVSNKLSSSPISSLLTRLATVNESGIVNVGLSIVLAPAATVSLGIVAPIAVHLFGLVLGGVAALVTGFVLVAGLSKVINNSVSTHLAASTASLSASQDVDVNNADLTSATAKTATGTVETAKSINSQSVTVESKVTVSGILNNVLNILSNSVAKYVSNIKVTINAIKVGVTGAASPVAGSTTVPAASSTSLPASQAVNTNNANLTKLAAKVLNLVHSLIASIRNILNNLSSKSEIKGETSTKVQANILGNSISSLAPPVNGLIARFVKNAINQLINAIKGEENGHEKNNRNERGNSSNRYTVQNKTAPGNETGSGIRNAKFKEYINRKAGQLINWLRTILHNQAKLGVNRVRAPPVGIKNFIAALIFGLSALTFHNALNFSQINLTVPSIAISILEIAVAVIFIKGGVPCALSKSKISEWITSLITRRTTLPLQQPAKTVTTTLGSLWSMIPATFICAMGAVKAGWRSWVAQPRKSGIVLTKRAAMFRSTKLTQLTDTTTNSGEDKFVSNKASTPTVAGKSTPIIAGKGVQTSLQKTITGTFAAINNKFSSLKRALVTACVIVVMLFALTGCATNSNNIVNVQYSDTVMQEYSDNLQGWAQDLAYTKVGKTLNFTSVDAQERVIEINDYINNLWDEMYKAGELDDYLTKRGDSAEAVIIGKGLLLIQLTDPQVYEMLKEENAAFYVNPQLEGSGATYGTNWLGTMGRPIVEVHAKYINDPFTVARILDHESVHVEALPQNFFQAVGKYNVIKLLVDIVASVPVEETKAYAREAEFASKFGIMPEKGKEFFDEMDLMFAYSDEKQSFVLMGIAYNMCVYAPLFLIGFYLIRRTIRRAHSESYNAIYIPSRKTYYYINEENEQLFMDSADYLKRQNARAVVFSKKVLYVPSEEVYYFINERKLGFFINNAKYFKSQGFNLRYLDDLIRKAEEYNCDLDCDGVAVPASNGTFVVRELENPESHNLQPIGQIIAALRHPSVAGSFLKVARLSYKVACFKLAEQNGIRGAPVVRHIRAFFYVLANSKTGRNVTAEYISSKLSAKDATFLNAQLDLHEKGETERAGLKAQVEAFRKNKDQGEEYLAFIIISTLSATAAFIVFMVLNLGVTLNIHPAFVAAAAAMAVPFLLFPAKFLFSNIATLISSNIANAHKAKQVRTSSYMNTALEKSSSLTVTIQVPVYKETFEQTIKLTFVMMA
ncbi:MAG: hypothetical protein NT014_01365 [Candidatus Omnitrophica bacterium]|nr:hypothetical protein [Candidatus Omnitrophota bacterium]